MRQGGNIYYMPAQQPPAYPVTFDAPPAVTVSGDESDLWLGTASKGSVSAPPSQLYCGAGQKQTAGVVMTIYYHAAGYVTDWLDGGGKL